jgi:hypothetical protein
LLEQLVSDQLNHNPAAKNRSPGLSAPQRPVRRNTELIPLDELERWLDDSA